MSRYHLLEFVFWELHKSAGLLACLSALQWPACVLLWGPPEASPGASVCQGRTEMKSCQGFGQGPQGDQLFTGNQRVHPAQGGVSRLFFNNVCPAPRMSCTVRWRRYNRTRERQSLSFEWPWSGSQIKGQGLNALPRLICTLLRWLGKRDMSCVLWTEMFILIISTKWQKFIFTSIQAVSWAETACILGLDHQQTPTDFPSALWSHHRTHLSRGTRHAWMPQQLFNTQEHFSGRLSLCVGSLSPEHSGSSLDAARSLSSSATLVFCMAPERKSAGK